MLFVVGTVATLAILLGVWGFLSQTAPIIPNRVCRFAFLFVVCVPLNFVCNYVNVWAFGYHRMSWTGAIIIAVLLAAYGTFLFARPYDPGTR